MSIFPRLSHCYPFERRTYKTCTLRIFPRPDQGIGIQDRYLKLQISVAFVILLAAAAISEQLSKFRKKNRIVTICCEFKSWVVCEFLG